MNRTHTGQCSTSMHVMDKEMTHIIVNKCKHTLISLLINVYETNRSMTA